MATPAEVKAAYRSLAKRLHPDRLRNPDHARSAEEKLKEINAAWSEYCTTLRQTKARATRHSPQRRQSAEAYRAGADYAWVDDEDEVEEILRRQRATPRTGRERHRAERREAAKDRDARERAARERAEQVRRERSEQIHERHTREHERIRRAVQTVLAFLVLFFGASFLLLLAFFVTHSYH